MSRHKSMHRSSLATGSCHWEVFAGEVPVHGLQIIFGVTRIPEIHSGHTCERPKAFFAPAPNNTIIVLIKFCIGFLKKWHPPGLCIGSLGGPRSVSAAPLSAWKSVVNVDAVPAIFHPEEETEDAIFIVLLIVRELVNSFRLLGDGRCSCQEPAITKRLLIDAIRNGLVEITPERWICWVSLLHLGRPLPKQILWWTVASLDGESEMIPPQRCFVCSEFRIFP